MAQQQNPIVLGLIMGLALILIGGALLTTQITFFAGVVAIIFGIVLMAVSVLGVFRSFE